jgi:hypothetical protein
VVVAGGCGELDCWSTGRASKVSCPGGGAHAGRKPSTRAQGKGSRKIEGSLFSFLSSSSQILNRRHPIPYSLPLPASADACDLLWVGHFYLGGQQSQSVHRDCSSIARAVEAIWLPSGSSFPGRWPRRHPRRLVRHVGAR